MAKRALTVWIMLGIAIVASLAAAFVLRSQARGRALEVGLEVAREELALAADLLQEDLVAGNASDRKVRALAIRLRAPLAVFNRDGRLLAEASPPGLSGIRYRGDHPEVEEAFRKGESSRRLSEGWHLARRLERGGRILGGVHLTVLDEEILAHHPYRVSSFFLVVLPFMIGAAGLSYLAVMSVPGPISRLRIQAERLLEEVDGQDLQNLREMSLEDLSRRLGRLRQLMVEKLAELNEGKALTASVLDSMREGVLAVGPDERVIFHNDAVLDLLNLSDRDLRGRQLLEVTRSAGISETYRAVTQRRGPQERKIRVENGETRHLDLRVVTLRDEVGGAIGALGVLVDVTRLEVLETVRQTFIANVSHELRTPLASIKAYTETLMEGALEDPEHSRNFLEVVLRHARRMEALVNDLTDLSLIETGSVTLDPDSVDAGSLVEDVLDQMEPRAASRQVRFVADMPAELRILGDRMRLEQVFVNVLENAVKFGPEGGRVHVRGWNDSGEVCVSIEDEGPGIPEQDLEKVFHRFYRVDKARSRELGGTGLGLSIVKHLMRLHGGKVWAENCSSGGARVVLRFPKPERSPLRQGG